MKYVFFTVRVVLVLMLAAFFTVISQVGGVVLLVSLLTAPLINKKLKSSWSQFVAKVAAFVLLYLIAVLVIVPPLAKVLGRVSLPWTETEPVRPANFTTVLLNRNYVRPELKQATFDVARQMNLKYPGTIINYLEANFPFIDGFPLLPHLSHSDGKKLDLSFHYLDKATGKITNEVPSWIGYGVCEGPRDGEYDRPAECEHKGYWQYSLMSRTLPQEKKEVFPFDAQRTRDLVNYFAAHKSIGVILIEPHLRTRLNLTSPKMRLHGCNAVRHDDHVHVQLR